MHNQMRKNFKKIIASGLSLILCLSAIFAAPGNVGAVDVSSVFSTTLYTGNGSTQTVNTGIDLATASGGGSSVGQVVYTTAGTYSWTCPTGVSSVSVVAVGAVKDGAGAALSYKNSIPVIPGVQYTVFIGAAGTTQLTYFINPGVVSAGRLNIRTGDGGGDGGAAGQGGGGAGGYAGNGGDGVTTPSAGNFAGNNAPAGGGGGGGASYWNGASIAYGGGGGGVGLLGQGASGLGGTSTGSGGTGGSGGGNGADGTRTGVAGGLYGGGGGSGDSGPNNTFTAGALRIMWGPGRSYPSTLTADQTTVTNNDHIITNNSGLVWAKSRTASRNHQLADTIRGAYALNSNSTAAQGAANIGFTSTGFNTPAGGDFNPIGEPMVSWTFKKAPKFFDVVTGACDSSGNITVNHSLGVAPSFAVIKRTNELSAWFAYHKDTGNNQYTYLNATNAAGTLPGIFSATSTTFTANVGFAASSQVVIYLFAHDTAADGIIQAGSYTGNGSSNGPTINLGWELQWLMIKRSNATNDWYIFDSMRNIFNNWLEPNTADAELAAGNPLDPTATGFKITTASELLNAAGNTYVYLAIRKTSPLAPTISVSPSTLAFGQVNTNSTGTSSFQVCNTGTADLTVTGITKTNLNEVTFTPAMTNQTLAPSACQTVSATFAPTVTGLINGSLSIASNDAANPTKTVTITGEGVQPIAPNIATAAASVNFGSINMQTTTSTTQPLQVCNTGASTLNLSGTTITGVNQANFSIDTALNGASIPPGGCVTSVLTFTPTDTSTVTANVVIASNDPDQPTLTIPMTGTATYEFDPAGLNFWFTVTKGSIGLSCTSPTRCEGYTDFKMGHNLFGGNIGPSSLTDSAYLDWLRANMSLFFTPCYSQAQSLHVLYGEINTCEPIHNLTDPHACYVKAVIDSDSISIVPNTGGNITGTLKFSIEGATDVNNCKDYSYTAPDGALLVENQSFQMNTSLQMKVATEYTTTQAMNLYMVKQATAISSASELAGYSAKIVVDHLDTGSTVHFRLFFTDTNGHEVLLPSNITVTSTDWKVANTVKTTGNSLIPTFSEIFVGTTARVRADVNVTYNGINLVYHSNELEMSAPAINCGTTGTPVCVDLPPAMRPPNAPERPIYSKTYIPGTTLIGSIATNGYWGTSSSGGTTNTFEDQWIDDNGKGRNGYTTYTFVNAQPWDVYQLCPESQYVRPANTTNYYNACMDPAGLVCPPARTNISEWYAAWTVDGWWCIQSPCMDIILSDSPSTIYDCP